MIQRLLALALLLLGAGCLEFDAQDVTVVYDAKADRIDVHLVYRGLFAEPGAIVRGEPIDKARQDLALVRDCGMVCLGANWPLQFDPTRPVPAPAALLLAHIDVENGGLFLAADGQLCGHQFLRIRDARVFLQRLDSLLAVAAQANVARPIEHGGTQRVLADETQELLAEFVRGGNRLLQVEPGRIELRLPCGAEDHEWLVGMFEAEFAEAAMTELRQRLLVDGVDRLPSARAMASALRSTPTYCFFTANAWSLVREQGLTRVALGVKGADQLVVRKAASGRYDDGLLLALRAAGEVVEPRTEDELRQQFVQFRTRAAVLPPRLAQQRAAAAGDATPDAGQGK
jgi:hypothetical protein